MSSPTPCLVYHEKQAAALCGQHCLNNLLQGQFFTAMDLADIAHALDAREREVMLSRGVETAAAIQFLAEDSGNIDEAGNFSISVLREALRRSHGLELSARGEDVDAALADPTKEEAFVLNLASHWFTVRKLYGTWLNLNSFLKRPAVITPFYLSVFLAQMRAEGYSIFVVRGTLPAPMMDRSLGERKSWHTMTEVLTAPPETPPSDRSETPDAALAAAISASMADAGVAAPSPTGSRDADDIALAIAMSMSAGAGSAAPAASPPAVARPASIDSDLARAIAWSQLPASPPAVAAGGGGGGAAAAAAPTSAAVLPPEPPAGTPGMVRVQYRPPAASAPARTRGFAPRDPATAVFEWASQVAAAPVATLTSRHPPLTLTSDGAVGLRVADLGIAPNISFV